MNMYSYDSGEITLHYISTLKRAARSGGKLFLPNRRFRTPLFRSGGQRRSAPPSAVETL